MAGRPGPARRRLPVARSRHPCRCPSFGGAASTPAAPALFQPARRRIQHLVDRRFNRARYDAERVIEVFAGRLRDSIDIDTVADELGRVVRDAVQPDRLSLWRTTASH